MEGENGKISPPKFLKNKKKRKDFQKWESTEIHCILCPSFLPQKFFTGSYQKNGI